MSALDEKYLYCEALSLLKRHGENAELEAAQRADAYLDAGELDQAKLWRGIGKKINLLRADAVNGRTVH